jgi:hypothetical protein
MPWDFWRLTVREFWLKHDAFIRSEGRAEAALIRQALRRGRYKEKDRNALNRQANQLNRYPVKRWLR